MKTKHDDGLEWLREIRRNTSAACGHDPARLVEHYRQVQAKYAKRLIRHVPRGSRSVKLAA